MNYYFRFAHPLLLASLIGLIVIAFIIRIYFYRPVTYRHPLINYIRFQGIFSKTGYQKVIQIFRIFGLLFLALLCSRPQWIDVSSKVQGEGIDIMLVLDVSRSMCCFDSLDDQRSRFEVAQQEAQNFIQKRENDLIGIVLFGRDAVSRCPLTLDKNIVKEIIQGLKIGDIDPDGTILGTALAMAVNRLKQSQAKSKIIVVLTDGEPTPEIDLDPFMAVELAKKLGVKIYAIGIGGPQGGFIKDPYFGIVNVPMKLNYELLQKISQMTQGQAFLARNAHDLKRIYETIDTLEKTEYETTVFTRYFDSIIPFLCCASILLIIECLLSIFVWFVL